MGCSKLFMHYMFPALLHILYTSDSINEVVINLVTSWLFDLTVFIRNAWNWQMWSKIKNVQLFPISYFRWCSASDQDCQSEACNNSSMDNVSMYGVWFSSLAIELTPLPDTWWTSCLQEHVVELLYCAEMYWQLSVCSVVLDCWKNYRSPQSRWLSASRLILVSYCAAVLMLT